MSMNASACGLLLRTGPVVGYSGGGVVVDVSLDATCQRCAQGRGCGMGLLARRQQQRITVFPSKALARVESAYPLGSQATIALPKHDMSLLACLVYALPLLMALLVAGVTSLLDVSEWHIATLFFSTLIGGVITLRYLMRGRMERFRPRLVS
ncbi:SoxR reducing system RseC family protein [Vreelandella lutescens]|uniref:Uncharacterized protein n=1 Tax=Vreelandella lutescens TaxID=1602943 RepID=A0ABQ1NSP2_9GAMM|nr:SoxR reducing system RseC family protein [Halomonas lutescens]GGC82391.1 hypothetical protein GCM10011382_10650 [Halomonas lutescens]